MIVFRVVLLLMAAFFGYLSMGIAAFLGWGTPGDSVLDRLDPAVVVMSVGAGMIAVVLVLAAFERRLLSPWLLIGALPVGAYVVSLLTSAS